MVILDADERKLSIITIAPRSTQVLGYSYARSHILFFPQAQKRARCNLLCESGIYYHKYDIYLHDMYLCHQESMYDAH